MSESPNFIFGTGIAPRDGKWHHIAAVGDADGISYYVDGIRIHPLVEDDE